jgi:hypothetical protein
MNATHHPLPIAASTALLALASFAAVIAHPLPAGVGLVLLMQWIGLAGTPGTCSAGRVIDHFGADRVVLATLLSALAGLLLWGVGAFATNAAQQARLVGRRRLWQARCCRPTPRCSRPARR